MSSASLPLDQPRAIVITDRGTQFTYKFRRIVASDWMKFFAAIVHQTEDGGKIQTFDMRTALQVLVEDALVGVDGFRTPGDVPADQLANWKQKLPVGQKINVGAVLKDIKVSSDDDADNNTFFLGETTDVSLECTWSAGENGKMTRYAGLIHRFQQPTIEQLRRYNRESSRARIIGGSRTGKTVWPGTQPLLASLYDDLIVGVDGYSFNGVPLSEQKEAIKLQMDTYHKVAAVESLFVVSPGEQAEETQEAQ